MSGYTKMSLKGMKEFNAILLLEHSKARKFKIYSFMFPYTL